jgi:hypothetical protein
MLSRVATLPAPVRAGAVFVISGAVLNFALAVQALPVKLDPPPALASVALSSAGVVTQSS